MRRSISLYVQGRGALKRNLSRACALGVPYVFSRKAPGKRKNCLHPGVMISQRPAGVLTTRRHSGGGIRKATSYVGLKKLAI